MKQIIIVRKDLKMSKGKTAAQVGHAVVTSMMMSGSWKRIKWIMNKQTKIILEVANEAKIHDIYALLKSNKIKSKAIIDAGRTEVKPGTLTCLAIEIVDEKRSIIDALLSDLKLLK